MATSLASGAWTEDWSRGLSTLRHLLNEATRALEASSSTPRLDAELLLAHVLGWSRSHLLACGDETPDAAQAAAFRQLVARRASLEPVAYLVGQREFYGLDVQVDARVLVPRPETELLVELAIGQARGRAALAQPLLIADVGTGSGAIALALAAHLPQAHLYASDISSGALEVAAANVARHGLQQRITLLQGDLLAPLPQPVHIIVSNPPYTILSQIDTNVYQHEPHLALDGGPDGLALYRRLLLQAPRWLLPGGALLLEIGAAQVASVAALVRAAFDRPHIAVQRDLAGHPRVVVAQTRPL
jgi:release factor glutamine methyltransferase